MSYPDSPGKSYTTADLKGLKGHKEGKTYENLTLLLLAKRGYKLSKCNSTYRDFSVGKEVSISKDSKFDDIIFSHEDEEKTKNYIFVQIKHKQDNYQINSQILSAKTPRDEKGRDNGHMRRDFNLQKHFISYINDRENLKENVEKGISNKDITKGISEGISTLNDRDNLKKNKETEQNLSYHKDRESLRKDEETGHCISHLNDRENLQKNEEKESCISYLDDREDLKSPGCEEVKKEKIRNVAIFTNAGCDTTELVSKRFGLKTAPEDITNLFLSEELSLRNQNYKHCFQLSDIPEDLREVLKKSSDLHRLAKELAQYVVWGDYRERNVLGVGKAPIKHYHFMLGKYVIEKSDEIKSTTTGKKTLYCDSKFRKNFIYNNESGPKAELRNAIFQAMRELDPSKKDIDDDGLKNLLKGVELKIDTHFGKDSSEKMEFPDKWITVEDEDIDEFLSCLVFFVNQPDVNGLLKQLYSEKDLFLQGTRAGEALANINPNLRKRIEKELNIYGKGSYKKVWLSGEKVFQFVQEQQEAVNISIMTLMYEDKVMQHGKFNKLGELATTLDCFLDCGKKEESTKKHQLLNKVLCIRTPKTLLSTIKILQHLNTKGYRANNGQISIELIDIQYKGIRDRIEKAFSSESHNLLTIECTQTVSEHIVNEFYDKLSDIIKINSDKKIIIITEQNERNFLAEKFKDDLQKFSKCQSDSEKPYIEKTDGINLQDFEPVENLLEKKAIVFQGQKLSLAALTDITSWNYFIDYLGQVSVKNQQDVIDTVTLILTKDEVEIGSKPLGTSVLECAYAKLHEVVNVETFLNKLLLLGPDNNCYDSKVTYFDNHNDVYIVSGITGTDEEERINKLIHYLEQNDEKLKTTSDKTEFKNQLKYIRNLKKLQVVDDLFKNENFRQICQQYPEKKVFWISVKHENNAIKFFLEQFYNPNFYLKRSFKIVEKVVIQKEVKELLTEENISDGFIFLCDKNELIDLLIFTDESKKNLFENNCRNGKIMFFPEEAAALAVFEDICKQKTVDSVHWLKVELGQLIWCKSHGSLYRLRKYIDKEGNQMSSVEEDDLIKIIKDRKVTIIADDPGMGKTTTLTMLCGQNKQSLKPITEPTKPITETHWILKIQLKDQIETIKDMELINGMSDMDNVVKFLSQFDSQLSHSLAKILLRLALDKTKNFIKPLILVFDGFDEVLDVGDRNKIISLAKFLKDETPAKLWITTRLHYKKVLENELSNFAIEFIPFDEQQKTEYIKVYLKDRLYLALSENKFNELFINCSETQKRNNILIYTEAFIDKMKSAFRGNISLFIGTPLQLSLMLEGTEIHFKDWVQNGASEIPTFNYIGNNIYEIYENFITRKYDVYFRKIGFREQERQKFETSNIDHYHKEFAVSKILKINPKNSLEEFKNIFLLAGVIKSHGSDLEFIHKTFEEFFAAKEFFNWIKNAPNKAKQEYLLKDILLKPEYQLIRTFLNLQLQKLSEQAETDEQHNNLRENLKHYGNVIAELLNEENNLLVYVHEKPIHIAIIEGNKEVVFFILNSLKDHPDVLKKCIFATDYYSYDYPLKTYTFLLDRTDKGTALHLAYERDVTEIVKILLDAAAEISEDTLKEFLECLDSEGRTALEMAVQCSNDVQILEDLLSRANCKLDLIMNSHDSALDLACVYDKEEFVEFLLHKLKHKKNSLKQLLLHQDDEGYNALCYAKSATIAAKLLAAAKFISNDALENLILPKWGEKPLDCAVKFRKTEVVEMLINAAKDLGDGIRVLKQLLLYEKPEKNFRSGETEFTKSSILNVAADHGRDDIIKLLLGRGIADLGTRFLKVLFSVTDSSGHKLMGLIVRYCHESTFEMFLDFLLQKFKHEKLFLKQLLLYQDGYRRNALWYAKSAAVATKILSAAIFMRDNDETRKKLLSPETGEPPFREAVSEGRTDVVELLLNVAKDIDDDNHTLKTFLLYDIYVFHIVSRKGYESIIKLLIKVAVDLDIKIFSKLIFATNMNEVTAIHSLVYHGHKSILEESFKMLHRDGYKSIRKKAMAVLNNAVLGMQLIEAIESNDIKEVKHILTKSKKSFLYPNMKRGILRATDYRGRCPLHIACIQENPEIIKELFSYTILMMEGKH